MCQIRVRLFHTGVKLLCCFSLCSDLLGSCKPKKVLLLDTAYEGLTLPQLLEISYRMVRRSIWVVFTGQPFAYFEPQNAWAFLPMWV